MRFAPFVLLTLAACGSHPPPPPVDDGGANGTPVWADGVLSIGADLDGGFTPMPAEVELHPGAQGGFHVPVRYEIVGQSELFALFEHKVRRTRDGVLLSRGTRTYDVSRDGDGGVWDSDQVVIFMCPTPVGVNVEGEDVTLEVTVKRGNGALLTTSTARTVLKCPADNQSFCQSICKG